MRKNYDDVKSDKNSKDKIKNTFLIGLGREISNILFDKTYNKAKVETRIKEIDIDNFEDKKLS